MDDTSFVISFVVVIAQLVWFVSLYLWFHLIVENHISGFWDRLILIGGFLLVFVLFEFLIVALAYFLIKKC